MSPDDPRPVTDRRSAHHPTVPFPLPAPRFEHLARLTHPLGMWEHAELTVPRVDHGFCTDDNARALIVVSRELTGGVDLDDLAGTYLRFLLDARTPGGRFHNRRDRYGSWVDESGSDDAQGRALWALGVGARHGRQPWMREACAAAFPDHTAFESVHLRANAFAVLGAVEFLAVAPGDIEAEDLLRRSSECLAAAAGSNVPWLEPRLTYDNARLPEALLAAGSRLRDGRLIHMGLRLLSWLVEVETNGDRFSLTPAGGRAPGGPSPDFDQQPLEAAAMAEACQRAWAITGDEVWRARGLRAAAWFLGLNDHGVALYDVATGGTRDGLMRHGVNENQGAESTLAGLAALQAADVFGADEPAVTTT